MRKSRNKVYDWEIIMSVDRFDKDGTLIRSRFFSPHSIASLTGRTDLLELIEEMKRSKKVFAAFCPIVKAPVFFLAKKYGHIYNDEPHSWNMAKDAVKQYPYPDIRGFKKAEVYWTGGEYGKGKCIVENTMPVPFIEEDYGYANSIINALKAAGFKPALKPYKTEKVNLYRAD